MNPSTNASPGRTLRVLQVTDMHLCAGNERLAGVDTRATCDAVVATIRDQEPEADLLLLTGDVVHNDDGDSAAAYEDARRRLEVLDRPGLVTSGNHDDRHLLEQAFGDGPLRCHGVCAMDNWLFLMLDSSVPGETGGHLSQWQLQWLDASLAAHPEAHVLVAMHHHPVAMGSLWIDRIGLDNSAELLSVLDRHRNVRVVLWGHVHQEYDAWRQGVRLLASPSACVQFAPGRDDFAIDPRPPGYRWLDLGADGTVTTGVIRLSQVPAGLDCALSGY